METFDAVFIIGPESSCTRMMTMLFCESGFYGDTDHVQRLDKVFEGYDSFRILREYKKFVYRQSIPHRKKYPEFNPMHQMVLQAGFNPFWILLERNNYCNIRSKVMNGHQRNIKKATQALEFEKAYIIQRIPAIGNNYTWVNTSSIMKNPVFYLNELEQKTGIKIAQRGIDLLYNADDKHLTEG